MKFRVTMKDPDTLHDSIVEAVEAELKTIAGLDDGDREALTGKRQVAAADVCGRWFKYSEYLTVEIDTDAGTAVVCPAE